MYDPGITKDNINDRISIEHYWGDFYKVTGNFSDGAGSYVVQWLVTENAAIRTHISDIESLMDLSSALAK